MQTLIIACTVSEILAQIDHKGPPLYLRTALGGPPEKLHYAGQHFDTAVEYSEICENDRSLVSSWGSCVPKYRKGY